MFPAQRLTLSGCLSPNMMCRSRSSAQLRFEGAEASSGEGSNVPLPHLHLWEGPMQFLFSPLRWRSALLCSLLCTSVHSSMPMHAQICEAEKNGYVHLKMLSIRNDWLSVNLSDLSQFHAQLSRAYDPLHYGHPGSCSDASLLYLAAHNKGTTTCTSVPCLG